MTGSYRQLKGYSLLVTEYCECDTKRPLCNIVQNVYAPPYKNTKDILYL